MSGPVVDGVELTTGDAAGGSTPPVGGEAAPGDGKGRGTAPVEAQAVVSAAKQSTATAPARGFLIVRIISASCQRPYRTKPRSSTVL
jgi:hypothetical protein